MPVAKKRRPKDNRPAVALSPPQQDFLRARNKIRAQGSKISRGLALYKGQASWVEITQTLPYFLREGAYRNLIWPTPFPRSIYQICKGGLPGIASIERELAWNVQSLIPFAAQINAFIATKKRFDNAFLTQPKHEIEKTLDECEKSHGTSLWLIEAKINYLETFEGHQQQRAYSSSLLKEQWQRYKLATLQPGTTFDQIQKALEEKLGMTVLWLSKMTISNATN